MGRTARVPSLERVLGAGIADHRAGRLGDAEQRYRQVLAIDPRQADSLHLLGVVASQTGRTDLAIELMRAAIAVAPRLATCHSNLGNELAGRGELDAAVACFDTALSLQPGLGEAHVNLGNIWLGLGRLDAAAACYCRALALQPDLVPALSNLGDALRQLGRLDEAGRRYRQALHVAPGHPEARLGLGNVLLAQKHPDAAIACFREVLEPRPDFLAARINLGVALTRRAQPEDLDEAVSCFVSAIALKPDHPDTYNNFGDTLMEQGLLDEASACFNMAVVLKPDYAEAHANLSGALRSQIRLGKSLHHARRAVALAPELAAAHCALGATLRALGQLDEAIDPLRRAVALQPDDAEVHSDLAGALLARGDMSEGWRSYEWRSRTRHMLAGQRDFGVPQWRGEEAVGRTLLIHAEQGFGDTLQFCRYASMAAARGLRVILEVQKPLVRLLGTLPGVEQVLARGEALPDIDLHRPMLSLPLAFATTLWSVPGDGAYLRADPVQVTHWQARFPADQIRSSRIGLLWAGNAYAGSPKLALLNRRRSLDPAGLEPLLALPGLQFFSLQHDSEAMLPPGPLIDVMSEMSDFADTAALIATLDLVISVDSAVAHLAGALGKPVWLLDRFDPCWRWMTGRTDSPWYPTLRIFRQPQPGDWHSVLADVVAELKEGQGLPWTRSRRSLEDPRFQGERG
ncbi:tetratricopeptide repeat protein [Lichenicola sp.]|uniref:tetratricopeptide repeat protein n=1 Tax=Lichenicola sp. TaxID=2804529 RepID=UPI003B00500E